MRGFFIYPYCMKKSLFIFLFLPCFLFSGCFLQKPIKTEKEYYSSGNLKLVRKIYKRGERIKYYSDGPTHH